MKNLRVVVKYLLSLLIVSALGVDIAYCLAPNSQDSLPAESDSNKDKCVAACCEASTDCTDSSDASEGARTGGVAWTFRADRLDDFAWENEHSGYRLYGPAFREQGGGVYGYDIWCKRFPAPILDRFYDLDHGTPQISYHKDHGEGFDGYTVGPTLGAGGAALMDGADLCYQCAYETFEVLEDSPERMTVKFLLHPMVVAGDTVREIRTITLESGAYYNKVSSRFEGLTKPMPIVAGIVVHADNPEGFRILPELSAVSVTDLSDDVPAGNGEIYVGVFTTEPVDSCYYRPFPETRANGIGEVVVQGTYNPGSEFTYYFGSGWSKGSVPTEEAWIEHLRTSVTAARGETAVAETKRESTGRCRICSNISQIFK